MKMLHYIGNNVSVVLDKIENNDKFGLCVLIWERPIMIFILLFAEIKVVLTLKIIFILSFTYIRVIKIHVRALTTHFH